MQHPISNHNNAAEYQVSSIPYLKTVTIASASTYHLEFPFVTRFLVFNPEADFKLGFSATGITGSNYFCLQSGTMTPRLEVRVRELWLTNPTAGSVDVSILAGLTGVPYRQFPNLSGIEGIG